MEVLIRWRQESVVWAFAFSQLWHCLKHVQFPFVEDFINHSQFTDYYEWVEAQPEPGDEAYGPRITTKTAIFVERHSTGQQQGAFTHKSALPQLISFQLKPNQHFAKAKQVGSQPTPLEIQPVVDADLRFAADMMCERYNYLEQARKFSFNMLKELRRGWRPVTSQLSRCQSEAYRKET